MSSKLAAQSWRIFVVMLIVFLALTTFEKYKNLPRQEPAHTNPEIISKNISYNKGFDDYVDCKTVKLNGLLDIDTGENEIKIAFKSQGKIKSIKGYCEVLGGYVKYEDHLIPFSGGKKDFWDERIVTNYTEQSDKWVTLGSSVIAIPLTKKDLHKTIVFDVKFDVVYPKISANKNSFHNEREEINEECELYIISEEEMKMKLESIKWNRRGSQKVTVILMTALTLFLTGFVVLYKRKQLFTAFSKR